MIPDFFERLYILKKGDSDIDGLNPEDIPHFPILWIIGIAIVILFFLFSSFFPFGW